MLRAPCPAPDCDRPVGPGKLMCPQCWGAVPPHLQKAVYAAYRAWRRYGTEASYDRLRDAQRAAIEAV